MNPLPSSSAHPGYQPPAASGANSSSQATALPLRPGDSPRVIRISSNAPHEWRNLTITFTEKSLVVIRNKPRRQTITLALIAKFETLGEKEFKDPGDPGKRTFRFSCSEENFIANCEIDGNDVASITVLDLTEAADDFTLAPQSRGEKRKAGSPPASPSTLHRLALRQSRPAHSRDPSGASDSGQKLRTPPPLDDYPRFFADAWAEMGLSSPASGKQPASPDPQLLPALPVSEEHEDQGPGAFGESGPATPAEHDAAGLLEEGIDPDEQRAFQESVRRSRAPDAGPSRVAGEGSSRMAAQQPPGAPRATRKYDEMVPVEKARDLLNSRPNIPFHKLFVELDTGYESTVGDRRFIAIKDELEYFNTYIKRQPKKGAPGETMRAKDTLPNLAMFVSERTAYQNTLSGQDLTTAKTALNLLQRAVFGDGPLVEKIMQLYPGNSDLSESAHKFEVEVIHRFQMRKENHQEEESEMQAFLNAKREYLSRKDNDTVIVRFLGYRPSLYKLDGDEEFAAAKDKLFSTRAGRGTSYTERSANVITRLVASLPEIARHLGLSKEELFAALKQWWNREVTDPVKQHREKVKNELLKQKNDETKFDQVIVNLAEFLPEPADSALP